MDGHYSHVTMEAIDYAIKHNIELVCLPPHSTHRLQPLDTHFNGPLKKTWSKEITKYLKMVDAVILNKHEFHRVFNPTWNKCQLDARCLLMPFNTAAFTQLGILPQTWILR